MSATKRGKQKQQAEVSEEEDFETFVTFCMCVCICAFLFSSLLNTFHIFFIVYRVYAFLFFFSFNLNKTVI